MENTKLLGTKVRMRSLGRDHARRSAMERRGVKRFGFKKPKMAGFVGDETADAEKNGV